MARESGAVTDGAEMRFFEDDTTLLYEPGPPPSNDTA